MVVQNQGTAEFHSSHQNAIQAATYSTHKRHFESFNAETRTHIKQIFPFILRISVECSAKHKGDDAVRFFKLHIALCII